MDEPPETPLVDIGIPVAGRTRYVAEAIESVLAQTLDRWRLVISEDGSGSGSIAAVVEPYLADARISFVGTGEPVGAARNMTALIERGSAPYVALLHDDDKWGANFLADRVAFLDEHPDCLFVFSPVIVLDADGAEIERMRPTIEEGIYEPPDFLPKLLRNNIVPSPSVVARRSAYEGAGGGFNPRLRRIYDYEMWTRLALNGPVAFLERYDTYWRLHDEQSSRSLADRIDDFTTFLELTDGSVEDRLPSARRSQRDRRRTLSNWLLTNALDALEQGELPVARRSLRRALASYPASVFDPRVPMAVLGLLCGAPARASVAWIRTAVRRHGIRAHLRSP